MRPVIAAGRIALQSVEDRLSRTARACPRRVPRSIVPLRFPKLFNLRRRRAAKFAERPESHRRLIEVEKKDQRYNICFGKTARRITQFECPNLSEKQLVGFLRLLVMISRRQSIQVTPQSNFSECYRRSYRAVIHDQRLRSAGVSADQDFIISPEDAQLARRKRRIIVIGSLVLVLAILFGVFGRRPAGNAIRAWQARRHAQKAFAFINKEQWDRRAL